MEVLQALKGSTCNIRGRLKQFEAFYTRREKGTDRDL